MKLEGGALPVWVYGGALVLLPLAVLLDVGTPQVRPLSYRWLSLLASFGICILIFFAMYAICTVQSGAIITGMQGRYLIGPLLVGVPAFSGSVRWTKHIVKLSELYSVIAFLYSTASFAALVEGGLRIYWMR